MMSPGAGYYNGKHFLAATVARKITLILALPFVFEQYSLTAIAVSVLRGSFIWSTRFVQTVVI